MNDLKHISEVCKSLDTTSRTIRYYEQLGLICTSRESPSAPRRLDSENIERLKKILFLRKIGLSLDEILTVFKSGTDEKELILTKAAEFSAEIASLRRRIRLLEKVVSAANNGEDIYAVELEGNFTDEDTENCRIASEIVQSLLERRFGSIMQYCSPRLKKLLTAEAIAFAWDEFTPKCGSYISTEEQTIEEQIIRTHLHFEKLDADILTSFQNGTIDGLLFQFRKQKEDSHVSSKCT